MELVQCAHCGEHIPKVEATPCTWKEYNLTWYYCKRCNNNCYSKGKFKVNNEEVIENNKI